MTGLTVNSFRWGVLILAITLLVISPSTALHLTGRWNSSNFFLFLSKFGFQQTTQHEKAETQGYIYGNVTVSTIDNVTVGGAPNFKTDVTFVVVDSEYFLYYFGNRTDKNRTVACSNMFRRIDTIAWDSVCNPHGRQDFLRQVPCVKGNLCEEEDDPQAVIDKYQFTYKVQDANQPRFWYISMVACSRNRSNASSCYWVNDASRQITIDYDIWIVNGDPAKSYLNPLEHHFSFELHDTFELYLMFFLLYTFLLPVQIYALSLRRHTIPVLITTCMCLEFLGIACNFTHSAKFAHDGYGAAFLKVAGNFIDMAAQCLFMLLLLLIVKGWTITRMTLPTLTKLILFTVWTAYTAASVALFIWNQMEVDLISDVDEWQTWPGWIILGFRLVIMLWFLWELRGTFMVEHNIEKTKFYLHFGAGFLVWFVYLPLITIVCTKVSALYRYKTILSVSYAADFLSLCVMVHLLWPSRSYLYFNLKSLQTDVDMGGLENLAGSKLLEYSDDDSSDGLSDDVPPSEEQRNNNNRYSHRSRNKSNGHNGHSSLFTTNGHHI